MLDTTSTERSEANLRAERDAARAEAARLRSQIARMATDHAATVRGYREQAQRDLSDLTTAQLEADRLRADLAAVLVGQLRADLIPHCPGCGKPAHASESDDDNYHAGCRPPDGFFSGPHPASRAFVSAMAVMEPDDIDLDDEDYFGRAAIEAQAERDAYRAACIAGCR